MKNWNFFFFAAIAERQLLVSPKIKSASGLRSSNTESILIKIFPIVLDGLSEAASRNISGLEIFKSLKKPHLDCNHSFVLYELTYA